MPAKVGLNGKPECQLKMGLKVHPPANFSARSLLWKMTGDQTPNILNMWVESKSDNPQL